jgi:hypothetical protein
VNKALSLLAGESRVYRLHLENAAPAIQRLNQDIDHPAVAALWQSLSVALSQPARLGMPGHIEGAAVRVIRELDRRQ